MVFTPLPKMLVDIVIENRYDIHQQLASLKTQHILALKQEETRDELGRRTAETRIDKRRAYCREQAEALVANEKMIKQKVRESILKYM